MSIPNSLTITSKGDRKLLIYIALAGLSAEFGRCLMLDLSLWDFGGFPASFLKQRCSIFLAAVSADLLYVNSLYWGLSLLQVVFLPSLIGCRPLFFFSGGSVLEFIYPLKYINLPFGLTNLRSWDQAKVVTCPSSLPRQPRLASCLLFIQVGITLWLIVCPTTVVTCPLPGNIKTTFIDLKCKHLSILFSSLWWWWLHGGHLFHGRRGRAWFGDDSSALIVHFISIVIPSALPQIIRHLILESGDPYPRGSLDINPSHESSLFYFIESKRPSMLISRHLLTHTVSKGQEAWSNIRFWFKVCCEVVVTVSPMQQWPVTFTRAGPSASKGAYSEGC